jgi:trimethylamine:corrinoid methyltransferase-like protein
MTQREIRTVTHRAPPVDMLSDDGLRAIQEATLEVLERTGIEVRSDRMLKELGKAGAVIDEVGGYARFPPEFRAGSW